MKRLLSLTALLLLAVASFAHDFEVDGIYYKITSSSSDSPTVSVSYKGSYSSSYSNEYTGSVKISETVTYSGKTYSVTSIGSSAFVDCSGLTSVTIPSSVTSIGYYAFQDCSGLTSITIPSSVTSIGNGAFSYCSGLTSITIPSSVTSISEYAFSGCSGLTSITISEGVKSIGYKAFENCSSLTKVIVPDIAKWCRISFGTDGYGNPLSYAHHLYNDEYTEIKELVIPDGVTSINDYAFSGCSGLTSITIPESVTSIGSYAFRGCSGLTKVIVSDIAKWCSISFEYSSSNPLYYAKHLYSDENTEITELAIPDGVTSIGSAAFNGCSGLTSVTIPESVTSIDDEAFQGCSGLTSITIPESVTEIYRAAFYGCSGLTSITIPEGVTYIGSSAFSGCSGLASINIPESVTWIGSYAFYGTAWYNNQPDGVVYAGNVAYKYKGTMSENTSIELKVGTTTICESAFSGCTGLTSITIPEGVTSIDDYAFYGCTGLTSITIPEGVTSIDDYAFYGCTGLTTITIPSSVTTIFRRTFSGCTNPDIKFYVDKNAIALFELWGLVLNTQTGKETYTSDCIYDVNTGEKIEFFNTTASSVSVKAFSPEPKKYTITSQSLTVDNKSVELPYSVTGLAPNTDSGKMSLTIKYKDAKGNENTFTASQTVKTQKLTLTTEQPKVVSMGNVVVSATTNVDEEEKNVGFEWRRTDWTSDFASNSGSAVVYGNTMEGYIRNLNTDKLWTYRAYYLSDAGTYYYGDWVGLDASNTSYFEPTVHTYADISTSGKVALIRGYVLNGTDKIKVQGFKYWKTANKGNSLDIAMEGEPQAAVVSIPANAITETVDIVGAGQQLMNATLENLDYGSTYQCVAFATTSENETFYGEVQTFTTEADPTGIEGVKEDAGSSKAVTVVACYDLNGKRLSAPQKGLNILRMSDGTTRKVVR